MLSKTAVPHLPEVSHVKQVERIKQLAVPQAEFVVAHFQKRPDILQAQKLEKRETNTDVFVKISSRQKGINHYG